MEYREAIEIFEETLTQVIVRMKKDGHTKKEIDQNKYIVHDTLPPVENYNSWSRVFVEQPPITWERLDCTGCTSEFQSGDYITVRGSVTAGYDTSRYNFLREYLPRTWEFATRGGAT